MSVVQFPGGVAMDASADLQVWNNAAFDNGEVSEDLNGSRQSWGSLKSVFGKNPISSFDSVSDKENLGFAMENNQVSSSLKKSSSTPLKTANGYESGEKSRIKGVRKKEIGGEKRIDEEIEEIESEIARLKSRLEGLKLEKAERREKVRVKRERAVAAKFMEEKEKQSGKTGDLKVVNNRRGLSLGPAEILSVGRRGMSMGPSEILRKSSRQETNTITPLQNRRKSCFFKLQGIEEEKETAKSSTKPVSRAQIAPTRQAMTTIGSRKALKKDETMLNSIQPKKLFEKSAKKPVRPGRVVASRYNQCTNQASAIRKRSLPENEPDNGNKKRSLSPEKSRVLGSESRVKKRWDIPSEVVVHGTPIVAVPELLPRLRIARLTRESPRDSGPAKKVVELIGRRSFFSNDEDVEAASSPCQALSFDDEGDEQS